MKSSPSKGASALKKSAPTKSSSASKSSASKSASKSSGSGHKENLSKIFEDTLKDIYWAEKYLVKALPKMSKAANDETLRAAFEQHTQETQGQIERLEQIFEQLGKRAQAKKCPAMEGLVEEGKEAMEEYEKGYARDAALIISGQKIEHYEIASYGSLKAHARMMGEEEIVALLEATEQEEGNTDKKLTQISETINQQAYAEGDDEEDSEEESD